jgi:hypothetical protein
MRRWAMNLVFAIIVLGFVPSASGQGIEYTGSAACADINDVRVMSNYAYCLTSSDLKIFDITQPNHPIFVGQIGFIGQGDGIYLTGNYAYLATGDNGLQIVNIANPADPVMVGSYDTPDVATGIFVTGTYAYVADVASGLQIIDISNRTNPTLAGTFIDPYGAPLGVFVSGAFAYIADGNFGLVIASIVNPAAPSLIGFYDTPGYANNVFVYRSHAFVADEVGGLQIINITYPTGPTLRASYPTPGWAHAIFASGNYAYLALGVEGIQMIDISDLSAPQLTAAYNTPYIAVGIYSLDNYIYVADRDSLIILRFNPTEINEEVKIPYAFSLSQNYPNPFNFQTTLSFILPEAEQNELAIYNLLGQKIAILSKNLERAGPHQIVWDANDVPSGIYYARLVAGNKSQSIKMTLLK